MIKLKVTKATMVTYPNGGWAIWKGELSKKELTLLYHDVCPMSLRPGDLLSYVPLIKGQEKP